MSLPSLSVCRIILSSVLLAGTLLVAACGVGGPALGQSCNSSSECQSGLTCDSNTLPTAGQCSATCASAMDCQNKYGPNTSCLGAKRCVNSCRSAQDCTADQRCNDFGWCQRKACDADSQCYDFKCDLATKTCKSTCTTNADCQGGKRCDNSLGFSLCV